MTAAEFRELLRHPTRLYQLPLEELKALALRFPYSLNIRQLLLLKAHLEGHPDEQFYLERCAAASFDRAYLREVLREVKVESEQEDTLELRELDELEALEALPAVPSNGEQELVADYFPLADQEAPIGEPSIPSEPLEPEEVSVDPPVVPPPPAPTPPPPAPPPPPSPPPALTARLARIRKLQENRHGRKEAADVNRIARNSLVAHDETASETLAGLLVRQGQYQNAIRMYQRLILLYPEKKPIFADLIQELKEKL